MDPARARYAAFPFPGGCVRLPRTPKAATMAALALYPACRPAASVVQRLAWAAVHVFGARALPGAPPWTPPFGPETSHSLRLAWASCLGSFDGAAVIERRQPSRHGFSCLLLSGGEPLGFVKVSCRQAGISMERRVLESAGRTVGFSVPGVLGGGTVDGWHWVALTPLPPVIHRLVVHPDVEGLSHEVRELLEPVLPPGPPGWEPMHGDFTVWNLRCIGRRRPWLLDWEDAAWAPRGADSAYFRATRALLRGGDPGRAAPEVVDFWLSRVLERSQTDPDSQLNQRLAEVLESMALRDGDR